MLAVAFTIRAQRASVTPERALGNPPYGTLPVGQRPALATNGNGFLGVWTVPGVEAVRYDREGTILDTTRIRIDDFDSTTLAVASDGHDYLIAYAGPDDRASVARVEPDGTAARRAGVSRLPVEALNLVWIRNQYVLAYAAKNGELRVVRLDRDGAAIDEAPIGLASAPPRIEMATNGGNAILLYQDGANSIRGFIVGEDGRPSTATQFALQGSEPSVAWDGENYVAAWRDQGIQLALTNGNQPVPFATIANSGFGHDPVVTTIAHQIAVLWRFSGYDYFDAIGTDYLTFFDETTAQETRRTRIAFVSPPIYELPLHPVYAYGSLTTDGTTLLVAVDGTLAKVTAAHSWTPEPLIARRIRASQYTIAATAGGAAGPMTVWNEFGTEDGASIIVSLHGREAFRIPHVAAQPVVAAGPSSYLIIWNELGKIFGVRADAAGQALDTTPRFIAEGMGETPALAWDGVNYLIAASSRAQRMVVLRLSEQGDLRESGGIELGQGSRPAIASNGRTSLIAWLAASPRASGGTLAGAFLSPSGDVTSPMRIDENVDDMRLEATTNGTDFLIAWQRRDALDVDVATLEVTRVRSDGSWSPMETIPGVSGRATFTPVWNGLHYFLIWTDFYRSRPLSMMRIDDAPEPVVTIGPSLVAHSMAATPLADGSFRLLYTRGSSAPEDGDASRLYEREVDELGGPRRRSR